MKKSIIKKKRGWSTAFTIKEISELEIIKKLEKELNKFTTTKIAKHLLLLGAACTLANFSGNTPLHCICKSSNSNLAKLAFANILYKTFINKVRNVFSAEDIINSYFKKLSRFYPEKTLTDFLHQLHQRQFNPIQIINILHDELSKKEVVDGNAMGRVMHSDGLQLLCFLCPSLQKQISLLLKSYKHFELKLKKKLLPAVKQNIVIKLIELTSSSILIQEIADRLLTGIDNLKQNGCVEALNTLKNFMHTQNGHNVAPVTLTTHSEIKEIFKAIENK